MNKGILIGGMVVLIGLVGVVAMYMPSNKDDFSAKKVQMSATIAPIAMIAEAIVGDVGDVHTILSPGASPHTFEPTPQDIRRVAESGVIFAIGHELDNWVTDIAHAAGDVSIVTVDTNVTLFAYDDHAHDAAYAHDDHEDEHADDHDEDVHTDDHDDDTVHADEHGHGHGEYDPHYWLNPDNARTIAATMRDTFIDMDAEGADIYTENYNAFIAALDRAEAIWRAELARVADSRIVTFHDAWGYFATYADVHIAATVEPFPGQQPTPKYLASLQDTIATTGVSAVFTEPQLASDAVASFIADTGVAYGILDPIGGTDGRLTYIDLMQYNIDTLVSTLK